MEGVPELYHDFSDVFSKTKADTLAPHQEYDLKIKIDETAKAPVSPIYPLSESELGLLRKFIDKHLNIGLFNLLIRVRGHSSKLTFANNHISVTPSVCHSLRDSLGQSHAPSHIPSHTPSVTLPVTPSSTLNSISTLYCWIYQTHFVIS